MDYHMCNGCRSLSRTSKVFAVLVASLVLSSVSSIKLAEQGCQPRPVVLPETQGHKPYHILLHRCSGTCDESIPPHQKPCVPSKSQEVEVDVTDPLSGNPKKITVYNHTSCNCDCDLECKFEQGEMLDDKSCKCIIEPTAGKRHDPKETVDVLPYKIGLASMGFVTLLVLVFELIMCAKRKEVLERVKERCCKKESHTDDKERKSNNSLNTAV